MTRADRHELSMRPGIQTLLQRSAWSAIWLLLAGAIWWGCTMRNTRIDALERRFTEIGGRGRFKVSLDTRER